MLVIIYKAWVMFSYIFKSLFFSKLAMCVISTAKIFAVKIRYLKWWTLNVAVVVKTDQVQAK